MLLFTQLTELSEYEMVNIDWIINNQ